MSDATAAMNGATSGERARNPQLRPPQQRQRPRHNRRPNLAGSSRPAGRAACGETFQCGRREPQLAKDPL